MQKRRMEGRKEGEIGEEGMTERRRKKWGKVKEDAGDRRDVMGIRLNTWL